MSENNSVPVGKVENISLPLEDWNEAGSVGVLGVQKPSKLDSPVTQVF